MGVVSRDEDESNRDIFGETALKSIEDVESCRDSFREKEFFRSSEKESCRGRFFPSKFILRMGRPLSRAAVPGLLLPVVCLRFLSRRFLFKPRSALWVWSGTDAPGEPLPYMRSNRFCSAV